MQLLNEISRTGRKGFTLPKCGVPVTAMPKNLLRAELHLPSLDESTAMRHWTGLSQMNYSVDSNFYPLGSCTMKYNPRMNEEAAGLSGFRRAHPLQGEAASQGAIELMYKLQESLKAITGFKAVTLQPAAGAHGELTGALMIRAYHKSRGETSRTRMLIPDSAHGTNPATCTMAGFITETIPSDASGGIDLAALEAACSGENAKTLAGIMITNPSTLGLFEANIEKITAIIHKAGGLVYGDGANMNAIIGIVQPASLGFDVLHINLHKTFASPHGGGGPGSGIVAANETLSAFLPGKIVVVSTSSTTGEPAYSLTQMPQSIGSVKSFWGNFAALARSYAYIEMIGKEGLRRVAEFAVLHANYLRELIKDDYPTPFAGIFGKGGRPCMHEFVAAPDLNPEAHINTMDIAKRLIDYGFHPPTTYFPLIVHEAFMVEPTETESKETLDAFADACKKIAAEAKATPELLKSAPHNTPVGRLNETEAARKPVLRVLF
ncbi:MAG: aminomethyl-transferring glycine dehydrogenase subunit GcvPB [Spirochaetaceae bacterium]|jgi:glycine dehydrogenase subunit 2|nr:aminomethyl-transferring glycine dehydrogenase subunit GcvPB [Spirochaetaceae bacterium]